VWRGMQYRKNTFITELETSARTESKRMTNQNTPHLSRMDLASHCATFLGLSLLNTRAVKPVSSEQQLGFLDNSTRVRTSIFDKAA
jgi:hypothetical protein